MPIEQTVTEEVTYQGRRTGSNGIVYQYQGDGPAWWAGRPLVAAHTVGAIVTIHRPIGNPNQYFHRGAEVRPLVTGHVQPDHPELLAWQVADRAAYEAKAQRDALRRTAKQAQPLEQIIDALSHAAQHLPGQDRAAFARYIADRIRGL